MKISKLFIVLYALLISSCVGSEFQRQKILGNYFITTTDNYNRDIYIGYKLETGDFVGVLSSKIIEIGNNEEFIIAKQSKDFNNKSDLNYYIIKKMEKTITPENGVLGPFAKEEFQIKIEELGLKKVEFKRVSKAN
ncbi:DUF3997 domain-containing protein [Pedobacter panaciterrae]|jgi:hypothetical protein|uniref:DUF3997 domain-containing protein n=1 Tax=Pedobacter panaciterrae TaxID=363849 RepID=A0ABU8NJ84_9SPHI|nr:DUF3997 domain-containing protein [Pedobacter panaciterrae]NQX55944.1 DUF3997 domain-containing protein [Pedobacter panaciterrae]